MVKYSIVITSYNDINTVKNSLESLLCQLNSDYEVIVVDNFSEDGTNLILKKYHNDKNIILISQKCSRGFGRKIGVLKSSGDYIISQLDLDEYFRPILKDIIKEYHLKYENYFLVVDKTPHDLFFISPKRLLLKIGNYNDLNYHEDRDLFWRAAKVGLLRHLETDPHIVEKHIVSNFYINGIKRNITSFRDKFRMNDMPSIGLNRYLPIDFLILVYSYFLSKNFEHFHNEKEIIKFNPKKYNFNKNRLLIKREANRLQPIHR